MTSWPAIDAFDAECATLVTVVRGLTTADLSCPTNCPPWTLHQLVVHIADSIQTPADLPTAEVSAATRRAADYYRRPERATDAYRRRNVDRTCEHAAAVAFDTAAEVLAAAWRDASAVIAAHDPDQPMPIAGLVLSVDAYVLTRLMSVAAHGLDVAITLQRPPFTTKLALSALRPVLLDLLGSTPPPPWTDHDLLSAGTGRRPLTATDRHALGPLAARFPLLS